MGTIIEPFTQEQSRALINLEQRYQVWILAEQKLLELPYNLARKEVKGHVYLYEVTDRRGNARSLGPWSEEQRNRLEGYQAEKAALQERRATAREALEESGRMYRALRLPLLADAAGRILREADRRQMLGRQLIVVGTNALPVYSIEAAGIIRDVPDETEDFDIAWTGSELEEGAQPVWDMLQAVDPTYTINTERTFQARNAKAYEVELLAAPSRIGAMFRTDRPMPIPLPEQEWLLAGRTVDHVVVCRDGSPARIVAPDPRMFALQKLWMSEQPKRNALKRPKDVRQAIALLDAVETAMPQYPLDVAFEASLPEELTPLFRKWAANRPARSRAAW